MAVSRIHWYPMVVVLRIAEDNVDIFSALDPDFDQENH